MTAQVDLELDADGDLLFSADGDLIEQVDVAQAVKASLQLFAGEWFLRTDAGVPWLQRILRKNPNMAHVRASLRKAILETPGVESLDELGIRWDRAARSIVVLFRCNGARAPTSLSLP